MSSDSEIATPKIRKRSPKPPKNTPPPIIRDDSILDNDETSLIRKILRFSFITVSIAVALLSIYFAVLYLLKQQEHQQMC